MDQAIRSELAPTGVLRAGINMSNFLLVTGQADNGDPTGVSPDMAKEIADRAGVPIEFVCYKSPGLLADAAELDEWNIGAEPQRAEKIAFSAAYCEIEATYLVPAGSPIQTMADVDKAGNRIAVTGRAAYGLWLERNIKNAELVKTNSLDEAFEVFTRDELEVLSGLRPRLLSDVEKLPGARILDGQFAAVQQAVGTPRNRTKAAAWLAQFVEEAKASGFVQSLIDKHKVVGLSVAGPA